MKLYQCLLKQNDCYKRGVKITPTKIVVHSTGANNNTVKRYVQPYSGQTSGMEEYLPQRKTFSRTEMLSILGTNNYRNDWNRGGLQVCVHAFLGKISDGSLAVVQTLPWEMRCWGVGAGRYGSYNNCAIQFEICEDDHSSASYCKETFELAAELCAHLMRAYPSITEIVSHNEAGQRGYGSDHNDPDNWWPRHGYTMGMLRRRVNELLKTNTSTPTPAPAKQLYRVRKSWADVSSQIGAFSSLENAKKSCPNGYKVFDEKGNVVYPVASAPATLYRVRKTWADASSQLGAYSSLENAKKVCKTGYSVFDDKGNVVYTANAPVQGNVENPQSFSKSKEGTYTVNADVGLHLRAGAGSNKTSLGVLPYGTKVQCFGYYTGEWLYVQTASGKVGFMHSGYLK